MENFYFGDYFDFDPRKPSSYSLRLLGTKYPIYDSLYDRLNSCFDITVLRNIDFDSLSHFLKTLQKIRCTSGTAIIVIIDNKNKVEYLKYTCQAMAVMDNAANSHIYFFTDVESAYFGASNLANYVHDLKFVVLGNNYESLFYISKLQAERNFNNMFVDVFVEEKLLKEFCSEYRSKIYEKNSTIQEFLMKKSNDLTELYQKNPELFHVIFGNKFFEFIKNNSLCNYGFWLDDDSDQETTFDISEALLEKNKC